jgi:chromosome segregation ATPase
MFKHRPPISRDYKTIMRFMKTTKNPATTKTSTTTTTTIRMTATLTTTTTTTTTTKRMTTTRSSTKTSTTTTTTTPLVKTTSKRMTAAIKPTEKPFNRVAPSNYTNVCPPVSTELSGDLMDAMSKSVEQTILYKKAKKRLMEAKEIVREIAEEGKEDREVIDILKKDLAEKHKEIERLSIDVNEMQKQGNIVKEEKDILDIIVATLRKELYNIKSDLKSELSSADKKRLELSLMQIELNNTKASLVKCELSAVGYQKHYSLIKTTNSLHHLVLEKKLSDMEKELDDMKTSIGDRIRQQNEETILLMQRTLGNTLSKLEKEHFSTVEKKDKEIKHLKHELQKIEMQRDRLKVVWGIAKKRKLYGKEITNADNYINNPNVKHPAF